MNTTLIVVDGRAGAGKGTLASGIACALGLIHADSGSMYRAIGLAVEDSNANPVDVARNFEETFRSHPDLRTDRGGKAAKAVAAIPEVRLAVNAYMANIISNPPGCVIDGRAGAWEFPQADVKIFLTAHLDERAARRCRLLAKTPGCVPDYDEVRENLRQRDHDDGSREVFPMKEHPEAFKIDNSDMQIHETLAKVMRICILEIYES